jgi:hypothetical protein
MPADMVLKVTAHTRDRTETIRQQLVESKHGRMVTIDETINALIDLWERMLEAVGGE